VAVPVLASADLDGCDHRYTLLVRDHPGGRLARMRPAIFR
jgi:hypothetical protein